MKVVVKQTQGGNNCTFSCCGIRPFTHSKEWVVPIIPLAVTGSPPGTNRYQGERTIANSKVRVGELYLWKVQEMLCCCGFVKSGKLSEKVVESRQRLGKSEAEKS